MHQKMLLNFVRETCRSGNRSLVAWKPTRNAACVTIYSTAFAQRSMSLYPSFKTDGAELRYDIDSRLRFHACTCPGCNIPSLAVRKMSSSMFDVGRRKHEQYENSEDTA